MVKLASQVIAIAVAELGYLEKKSNSQLDDKTANAGSANWTKYARDLDAHPEIYNFSKAGHEWCDIFVDWCFYKAFGVDGMQEALYQPDESLGAGCTFSAQYFRNKGKFFTSNPQPGDQIFFGKIGDEYHTGLVEKIVGNTVYTIEGNTSGASGVIPNGGGVCRKSYHINSSSIAGYGRPNYDGVTTTPVKNETTTQPTQKVEGRIMVTVSIPQLSKGDKGDEVKTLQNLLKSHNYSVGSAGVDGDFGDDTDSAVRRFQKAKKIDVDGIVGKDTWGKLLRL